MVQNNFKRVSFPLDSEMSVTYFFIDILKVFTVSLQLRKYLFFLMFF